MNSEAYDRIIDRYLNGRMSPAEERDFFQLLELDDDLRATFEAEKLIGETTRRDAEKIGGAPAESYTNFLAALATVGAAAGTVAAAEASAATTTASGSAAATTAASTTAATTGSSFFGTLLAGGIVKGVIAAVSIAAVGTVAYLASPFSSASDEATTPSAIERRINDEATPMPGRPDGASEDRSAAASTTVPQESESEVNREEGVRETPVLGRPAANGNVGAPASMNRKTEQPASPVSPEKTGSRDNQRNNETPAWEEEAAGQPMKVIVNDSVSSTVKVERPR